MNLTAEEIMKLVENASKIPDLLNSERKICELLAKFEQIENYLKRFNSLEELVRQLAQVEENIIVCKSYLTTNEAAKYLSTTKHSILAAVKRKELNYYCPPGKGYYFSKEELDNWVLKYKVSSNEVANAKAYFNLMEGIGCGRNRR